MVSVSRAPSTRIVTSATPPGATLTITRTALRATAERRRGAKCAGGAERQDQHFAITCFFFIPIVKQAGSVASRKVALVTGGATGIGKSAVLALARAGYDVVVTNNSARRRRARPRAKLKKLGARALLASADVSDEAGVRSMLDSVKKTLGGSTC